jgi:glycosyltransferase involved in cell wall biosynthesis
METASRFDDCTGVELSIVLPCLDEAETLGTCIGKATAVLRNHGIRGEVIVADNGSSDESAQIAVDHGARLVNVKTRGYGAAVQGGIEAARGQYVLIADADDSYEFGHVPRFLTELRNGAELVLGNRFRGGIEPGAMPLLHRYLGNPILSGLCRLLFHAPVGDVHCGMRAFSQAAHAQLGLRTTGMEFASEMIVKAALRRQRMVEVPTTLKKDGRSRTPHLRTWPDGWRHLRLLLMHSPQGLLLMRSTRPTDREGPAFR